jgi:hypothetical protein
MVLFPYVPAGDGPEYELPERNLRGRTSIHHSQLVPCKTQDFQRTARGIHWRGRICRASSTSGRVSRGRWEE